MLEDNPIADKRLYKLILQCRTKQICDYVKQHGADTPKGGSAAAAAAKSDAASKGGKQKEAVAAAAEGDEEVEVAANADTIHIHRHTDDSLNVVYVDHVKEVRPFILCCVVRACNLDGQNFKRFLQIQSKLHDTVCMKREQSTIATHDLNKITSVGQTIRYTAREPHSFGIVPLGKVKKVSAQKFYDQLKAEAEAMRKEKKRNIYSGIHKYLYMLEKKTAFACVEDAAGNVISLPPLTNGESTKVRYIHFGYILILTNHFLSLDFTGNEGCVHRSDEFGVGE